MDDEQFGQRAHLKKMYCGDRSGSDDNLNHHSKNHINQGENKEDIKW